MKTVLQQFLLQQPAQKRFVFGDEARREIRRALFLAVSANGKYLHRLLPQLGAGELDAAHVLEHELEWLFAKYRVRVAQTLAASAHAGHANLPCAKIFRRGEPIYKCLTCGYDDTCALCSDCYDAAAHAGHVVHVSVCQRENGGVCDCGDPEAWVLDYGCRYARGTGADGAVPADFAAAFAATVEVLLDYVIDVMSQSDVHLYAAADLRRDPEAHASNCTLDSRRYGFAETDPALDPPSDTYSLIAYNDQVRHFRDVVQRIRLASKKVPAFAAMVAERIQDHGRATVVRSRNVRELLERQQTLSSTGLASCVRNARDEFREDMCHEMLVWLRSLTECEQLKASAPLKHLLCRAFCRKWRSGLVAASSLHPNVYSRGHLDTHLHIPDVDLPITSTHVHPHWQYHPPRKLAGALCAECEYDNDADLVPKAGHLGSRFQYMAFFDIRFWKLVRMLLHDLYAAALVTNLTYKGIFSSQYVDVYPAMVDSHLCLDSQPELNIMSTLSTQLFTCPSNSTAIIEQGEVTRIFASIYSFLKYGHVSGGYPETWHTSSVCMSSLKNRLWGKAFLEIGYILTRGRDHNQVIVKSVIPETCDVLALFQGRPVMTREKENHVEYETSDYTAFFHAVPVMYQLAEQIAQLVTNRKTGAVVHATGAIAYVFRYLLDLPSRHDCAVEEFNKTDYMADAHEQVSFLHPLHSFLLWLIEFTCFDNAQSLLNLFATAVKPDSIAQLELCLRQVFQYPMKTIVLASQIKSGYWVRNGFSVRNQLQLYKNTSIREQGYLRDIFLVQLYLTCSTPDVAARFLIDSWLFSAGWAVPLAGDSPLYEPSILTNMLEEFANFLIHILTDDIHFQGLSSDETTYIRIKNEIIHHLCFGPTTYLKLCSQLPSHICAEKRFDAAFEELTTMRRPNSSKDAVTFVLKDEYLDQVNPYYYNYLLNRRDEAITFVKGRLSGSKPASEAVIVPTTQHRGCFQGVEKFTQSLLFADFVIRTIRFIFEEKIDGLLETVLHLLHICVVGSRYNAETAQRFQSVFLAKSAAFGDSIAANVYKVLEGDNFKDHHAKVRAIFHSFQQGDTEFMATLQAQVTDFDLGLMETSNPVTDESEKKSSAKARQQRLIAKFKKQQSLFLKKNHMDVQDDVEMEEPQETGWHFPDAHCILCQDTVTDAGPFGIISYISKSSVFWEVPFNDRYWFLKSFSDPTCLDASVDEALLYENYTERWRTYMAKVDEDNVIGPGFKSHKHVNSKLVALTCGHGMHFNCYAHFLSSNRSRSTQITRNNPDSIEHREFLCPLCKAMCNMFIPILWTLNNRRLNLVLAPSANTLGSFTYQNIKDRAWFGSYCEAVTGDLEQLSLLTPSAKEMIGANSDTLVSTSQQHFRILLSNMFQILSLITFPQTIKADSPSILINSIKATEISLRGTLAEDGLVHQIPNNTLIILRALNEFRNTSILMKLSDWLQSPGYKSEAHIKLLANLASLAPQHFNASIITRDFFELLVENIPVPLAEILFHNILEACYVGHVIQSLYLLVCEVTSHDFHANGEYSLLDVPYTLMLSQEDAECARRLFEQVSRSKLDFVKASDVAKSPCFGYVVYSMLIKCVTPFLRQAAIYAFVCCSNVEGTDFAATDEFAIEADRLAQCLRLPKLATLFRQFGEKLFAQDRFADFRLFLKKRSQTRIPEELGIPKTLEYPGIVRLIKLPERLDHFFTKYYYLDKYDNPHLTIENPAICLFCSEVVDVQKNAIGTRFGQCSTHFLKECPNSVGIFLLPKERISLLLHRNGGSFHEIPYLDQYGEISSESKRGKTVSLSQQRYEDFTRSMWLQNNVANYVVRKLDSVIDAGGWETL